MNDLTGGQVFVWDRCSNAVGHNIIRVQARKLNLEMEACAIVPVLCIPSECYSKFKLLFS